MIIKTLVSRLLKYPQSNSVETCLIDLNETYIFRIQKICKASSGNSVLLITEPTPKVNLIR